MNAELIFHGKAMKVKLSEAARRESQSLSTSLLIEIQVYFSCMLGKRLAFYADQPFPGACELDIQQFSELINDSQCLTDKLFVRFNTVMTASCPVADYDGPPPVTDFPIPNKKPYVPDWLSIDFRNGIWCGEYGWGDKTGARSNTKQIHSLLKKRN